MSQNKNNKRSRVLIIDDHPAGREALALRIGLQRDLGVSRLYGRCFASAAARPSGPAESISAQ
jgi:hypothetical protein